MAPVHELGEGTVRGRWAEPTWMLTVSAASAPTLTAPEGASQAYSQYSLNLQSAEVPAAEGAPDKSGTPAVEDTAARRVSFRQARQAAGPAPGPSRS